MVYYIVTFLIVCLGIEIIVVIDKMEKLQTAYNSLSQHTKDVDGGWSGWQDWGTCSKTCEGGLRTRQRTCTNPVPSHSGRYCNGSPEHVEICQMEPCKNIVFAFSVSDPGSVTAGGSFYRKLEQYKQIHINTGGDFNPFSGVFTCSTPGIYYFFATLVKKRSSDKVDLVECKIYKNTSPQLKLLLDPTDDDTDIGHAAVSNSIVMQLIIGDTVFLGGCWDPHMYMESWTSFSGFLLYHSL